jgi:eukaryotic-like serine/threonine-protein kinase
MTGGALIGRTIAGRFRVTGFIGEGAMAAVYRGSQDAEPRDVAIKVMHAHLLADGTFLARFRREAKAAAQIKHANSVRIVDCGIHEKLPYIAMELLAGQDLFEVLMLERRLSEVRAIAIMSQVCDALAAAHEQGIVHRDLKPENIMLVRNASPDGADHVKVLDFGIAKILEPDAPEPGAANSGFSTTALTKAGMVVGTPAYMSPEQCRGEAIDGRSDVYACGILLYQLLTGRLPFDGKTAMDFAVLHVRTPPTRPSEVVNGMHPGIESAILRALSKWPAQRQEGAIAFKNEIELAVATASNRPLEPAVTLALDGVRIETPTALARLFTPEPQTRRRSSRSGAELEITQPSPLSTIAARPAPAVSVVIDDRAPTSHMSQSSSAAPMPPSAPALDGSTGEEDGVESALTVPRGPSPPRPPVPAAEPPPSSIENEKTAIRREDPPVAEVRAAPRPPERRAPARKARRDPAWVLVPAALFVGMAIGTVLFFLFR